MQLRLDGEDSLVESVRLLRTYEPPEGYWLAFSGGKDSCVLKAVADLAGVRYDAHYNVTGLDAPELVRFIRQAHPDVAFERPQHSFCWHIEHGRGLPWRHSRWCCEELKERGGDSRVVCTGVRRAESRNRANVGHVCTSRRGGKKLLVHPLAHWTDAEVWEFIRSRGLPYCCLYDEGFKRLGCVPCPFEHKIEQCQRRWPHLFAAIHHAIERGWEHTPSWQRRFADAEAVWQWWIDRSGFVTDGEDQLAFEQIG